MSKASDYCYASKSAITMFQTGCETEMHLWKYAPEKIALICLRVATLLIYMKKTHTKSDVIRQYLLSELSRLLFVLNTFLAAQVKT